jgi:hypothetical protein
MANPQIEVEIGAKIKSLFDSLNDAEGALQKFAGKAQKIGTALSLAITTPLLAIAGISISNFDKQAQAIGQIESALKSTGGTAGLTSKELQKIASELQNISVFGDEEILQKSTAQLLTFTNIAGEQFKKTQKAALDLATRLGGDLQGATIQLGKALNDPVEGLSALGRSGIQFSKDQKQLIKSLAETNRLAEAQDLILAELEKQYGGAAEAAAQLGLGPLRQLQNQFGDLLEDIGKILIEGFLPLVNFGKKVITFFQGLSDETKKATIIFLGIAASIGPVLIGIGTLIKILPFLGAAFTALTGPIGIVVTAVAIGTAAIILNWEEVQRKVKVATLGVIDTFISLLNAINVVASAIPGFSAVTTGAILALEVAGRNLAKSIVDDLGKKSVDALDDFGNAIDNILPKVKQTFEEFSKLQDIANEKIFRQFAEEANAFNKELDETIRLAKALESIDLSKDLAARTPRGIVDNNILLDGPPVIEIPDIDESSRSRFIASLRAFNDEASAIISNGIQMTIGDFAFSIGEALGNGANVLKAAGGALLNGIAQIANQLGQAAIAIGVGMIAIQQAFSNPFTAIAAGVALIALAGFISSKVPKITSGGAGGGVGTSGVGAGSSFTGTGGTGFSAERNINLVGSFRIAGSDLLYVIDQSNQARI